MKTSIIIFLFILTLSVSSAGQGTDSVKYKSLSPYYFHLTYLKEDKAMLIDVREFFEYRRSRLKDAVNIPSSGKIEIAADSIEKDYALLLYCTNGYRSIRVARIFCDKGFGKVYSLDGGIVAWRKEGLPVVRGKEREKGERERGRKGEGGKGDFSIFALVFKLK